MGNISCIVQSMHTIKPKTRYRLEESSWTRNNDEKINNAVVYNSQNRNEHNTTVLTATEMEEGKHEISNFAA